MANIDDQQTTLAALARRLDDLESREAIRTCIYRVNRGIDRIDAHLLEAAFFPDAQIRWGTADHVRFDAWLQTALGVQQKTKRVQHLIGNILIDLRGDDADVEVYEIARHLTPLPGGEMKDLIIASRYIDKFERRGGDWRIARRDKVVDWVRVMEGADFAFDHVPLKQERDTSDISFEMFGHMRSTVD